MTQPDAPAQRTPRHLVAPKDRISWLPEAAIAAGAVIAASGGLIPLYALPCAATGLLVVAAALAARIRRLQTAVAAPASSAPGAPEPVTGTELRMRLRAHLRDIALTASLPDAALRVYRREADGFVRIDTAETGETAADQHVLTAAWQNGVAKLPRRDSAPPRTVAASRINDRHSNRPIAVVVIDPQSSGGDEAVRRARTSEGWARLCTFLETADIATVPRHAIAPVRIG